MAILIFMNENALASLISLFALFSAYSCIIFIKRPLRNQYLHNGQLFSEILFLVILSFLTVLYKI
jgi:hypothetical protein